MWSCACWVSAKAASQCAPAGGHDEDCLWAWRVGCKKGGRGGGEERMATDPRCLRGNPRWTDMSTTRFVDCVVTCGHGRHTVRTFCILASVSVSVSGRCQIGRQAGVPILLEANVNTMMGRRGTPAAALVGTHVGRAWPEVSPSLQGPRPTRLIQHLPVHHPQPIGP